MVRDMKVLVTGGAGYIGSHTCLELLRSGHEVSVVDSLYNGSKEALTRVQRLSNRSLEFNHCDVRDEDVLDGIFDQFKPDAVIHFAGLKAVGESVTEPARYYDVNVGGTATLLGAMERAGCANIVFSSSATVAAVEQLETLDVFEVINIGTGKGLSVLQMIKEFEIQSGKTVRYQIAPRRPGDAPAVWADATKVINKIGFKAKRGIVEMCQDTWLWQDANPMGYKEQ